MLGAYVVEQWHNGEEWYRKWSNGFCEQGGYTCDGSGKFKSNVSFIDTYHASVKLYIPFSSSDYCVFVCAETAFASGSGLCGYDAVYPGKSNKSFKVLMCYFTQSGSASQTFHYLRQYWEAKGWYK